MEKFVIFSKLFFILFLITLLCGGTQYIYQTYISVPITVVFAQVQIQPPVSPTIATPTKTIFTKSVNAFLDYHVTISRDWQVFKQEDPTMNTLTLSNGMYQIVINQEKSTPFRCKYPDTRQTPNTQLGKSKLFVSFSEKILWKFVNLE